MLSKSQAFLLLLFWLAYMWITLNKNLIRLSLYNFVITMIIFLWYLKNKILEYRNVSSKLLKVDNRSKFRNFHNLIKKYFLFKY